MPAPGRRMSRHPYYKRFNILPQDEDGMQKPVGAAVRRRPAGRPRRRAAARFAPPSPSRRVCQVRRRERVAVRRPAASPRRSARRGHVRAAGIQRTSAALPPRRRLRLDGRPASPRPRGRIPRAVRRRRLEVGAAPERWPEVVRERPHVEAGASTRARGRAQADRPYPGDQLRARGTVTWHRLSARPARSSRAARRPRRRRLLRRERRRQSAGTSRESASRPRRVAAPGVGASALALASLAGIEPVARRRYRVRDARGGCRPRIPFRR